MNDLNTAPTEIRFYHLGHQTLEDALPALLFKIIDLGRKVVVKMKTAEDTERMNEWLWTYNPGSFLPHGTQKDGYAGRQPVWITAADENPNGADVLILCQGATSEMLRDFKLCCEMLDGNDPEGLMTARARWKDYKSAGFSLTYWQQEEGKWNKRDL